MILTILIPTRNREHRVQPLVLTLISGLNLATRPDVEILVLNNCSSDNTEALLRPMQAENVRIVTNPVFYPSSEQNVFNNLHLARGEFVWFLGDDDLPRVDSVLRLIDLLQADCADLFINNFRVIDEFGRIGNVSQARGAVEDETTDIVSLIKRIGIINFFSGWSLIVARRSLLNLAVAERISAVNPIYAHCFWLIECFKNARTRFQVQPLVDYRIFHQEDGWDKYTGDQGVGALYQWHLGVLRLYDDAMKNGSLGPRDFAEIYEYRHGGSRYRAVDEIVFKLVEQADFYVKTLDDRNLLKEAEIEEAIIILLKADFTLQDALYRLRSMYEPLWSKDGLSHENLTAQRALRTKVVGLLTQRRDDLCQPFFVRYLYGYQIFYFNLRWVAVHSDGMGLMDSVFAQFVPRAMPPDVLVETTEDRLITAILRSPSRPEPLGERPPLSSMAGEDVLGPRPFAAAAQDDVRREAEARVGADLIPIEVTLLDGWSHPESNGIWSVGDRAQLILVAPSECERVHLRLAPYVAPGRTRRGHVTINRSDAVDLTFTTGDPSIVSFGVPEGAATLRVSVVTEPSPTPADVGQSPDERRLGVFLMQAWAERPAKEPDKPGAPARPFARGLL